MKVIGLTGGIGSGKSTVAKLLETKGIPVYYSDIRAKEIMNDSQHIVSTLTEWHGEDIYLDGMLNRVKLGEIVFNNSEELQKLNALVHPEVFKDFENWKNAQDAPFIVKEAAILFESGSYKLCDVVVTVSANYETRILRTIERDGMSRKNVKARMSKQWTDEERAEKADYIIRNDGSFMELEREVEQLYYFLQNHA